MGFLNSLFNNSDPEEVYKITTKGLIAIINKWVDNIDDLGMSNRLNEFLTDDFTIGFLLGFIFHISDKNNIRDRELKLGILGSSIRESFSHIMTADENYNLFNDKINNYQEKNLRSYNDYFDDKASSHGRLVADAYLRSSNDDYYVDHLNNKIRMSPDSWANIGANLPNQYFNKN